MELPGVDDVTAGAAEDGGRPASTALTGDGGSASRSSRCKSGGVRRISVAPASVTQTAEPPPDAIYCSWKPMNPGYVATGSDAVLIERTVRVEDFDDDVDDDTDNSFRLAIPVMSLSLIPVMSLSLSLSDPRHESLSGRRLRPLQRPDTGTRFVRIV